MVAKKDSSKPAAKRTQTARRYHKLHEDGSIERANRTIERVFNLPAGSVKLVYPSGRKARADSTVGNVRKSWAKK